MPKRAERGKRDIVQPRIHCRRTFYETLEKDLRKTAVLNTDCRGDRLTPGRPTISELQ